MSDPNTANTPSKISSGTANTSEGGRRRRKDAVGDLIAARLTSLIEDSIQQVVSVKEQVQPLIRDVKGRSDEITDQLHQSRQQALVRKNKLEAERQEIHQAACQVIKEHNKDTANDS